MNKFPVWEPWDSKEKNGMSKGDWNLHHVQRYLKIKPQHTAKHVFYYRKYSCFSCEPCRTFKTDPFTGKVKCEREHITGAWKKGRFIRKRVAVSDDESSSEEESSSDEESSS